MSTKIDHRRAAKRAARLPHVLLGWVGQDGLPVVVPVEVTGADEQGIVIEGPRDVISPGRRRAGLTAHWFSRHVIGQDQRMYTGWLDADPAERRLLYVPHTERGYRLPPSPLLYRLVVGFETRRRHLMSTRGKRTRTGPDGVPPARPAT